MSKQAPVTNSSHAGAAWGRVAPAGLAAALLLGLAVGWLRYWFGFFVLIQGAAAGLLLAWLMGRAGRVQGRGPAHPGFGPALGLACLCFASFAAGELLGTGLAQPWFDPLGWLGRVWEGKTVEPAFGIAATGPVHRAFAGGAQGGFWLLLNLIDWLIMIFFLLAMPWDQKAGKKVAS
jgi:hypothetical protein